MAKRNHSTTGTKTHADIPWLTWNLLTTFIYPPLNISACFVNGYPMIILVKICQSSLSRLGEESSMFKDV